MAHADTQNVFYYGWSNRRDCPMAQNEILPNDTCSKTSGSITDTEIVY